QVVRRRHHTNRGGQWPLFLLQAHGIIPRRAAQGSRDLHHAALMLRRPDGVRQETMVAARIVALDRSRTFITLLVVLYHSVINYTYYGIGGDRMRWIGFDGVALFCDSFFMACMFFISGLFVAGSLARRGAGNYLASRILRLGVPYLVSILVIMPLVYYRYHFTQYDFAEFYWRMLTVDTWPVGSSWFVLVLLVFDLLIAVLWSLASPAI